MGCSDIWARPGLLLHGAIMNKMSYCMLYIQSNHVFRDRYRDLSTMLGKGQLNWSFVDYCKRPTRLKLLGNVQDIR
jgi:hypothetical protein